MKRFLLLIAAFSITLATPAAAKVIEAVELCGKSECRSLPKSELRGHQAHDWVFGGAAASAVTTDDGPPRTAGRWRASLTIGDGSEGGPGETFAQIVAPEAGYLRVDGIWRRMSATAAREWTSLVTGLEPLPHPKPEATGEASTVETTPPPADETSTDQAGAGGGPNAWPWVAVGAGCLSAALALWHRRRASIR